MERQLLLLGLLLDADMHGYQLNEHIEHTLGYFTNIKKPTVYYSLDKLEKEGYVRQEIERDGNRPDRRVYRLTDAGRDHFFNLLRQKLQAYSRTYFADDIAISFIDLLPRDEAYAFLTEKRIKTRAMLDELQNHPRHGGSFDLVVSHNVAHLEAEVRWLDDVLDYLAERTDS